MIAFALSAFGVTSLQLRYNPAMTEACSLQHFDAMQNDPRFPAILKQLKANGFIVNGSVSSSHWLSDSLTWDASKNFNRNLAAWQSVQTSRTAAYKTKAYFDPAVAINPATILSDYDDVTWSTGACSLDQNGFWQNGCNFANNTDGIAGNRQGPDFYGWMHNVTDKVNFPGSQGTLGPLYNITSFEIAPFNALMWCVSTRAPPSAAAPCPHAPSCAPPSPLTAVAVCSSSAGRSTRCACMCSRLLRSR